MVHTCIAGAGLIVNEDEQVLVQHVEEGERGDSEAGDDGLKGCVDEGDDDDKGCRYKRYSAWQTLQQQQPMRTH